MDLPRAPICSRMVQTRALLDQGARPWQAELVGPMLVAAFEQFPDP